MLTRLSLINFRCFDRRDFEFQERVNWFVGPNAAGKTSVLEAICVLLRLQSPRVSALGRVVRHGAAGFSVQGDFDGNLLQFYYGHRKKKLALNRVEQSGAEEYLKTARIVYFGNDDREIAEGSGEARRRFLDFAALQYSPQYREAFRRFQRALRSRNALLKGTRVRRSEVEAFDGPLADAGEIVAQIRWQLVTELSDFAPESYREISGGKEKFALEFQPSTTAGTFSERLRDSYLEDVRLRTTNLGPHRDDLILTLGGTNAKNFASEGQQRSMVLALKLAHARLVRGTAGPHPILLLDDVFGELDPDRRRNLMRSLPQDSPCFMTTTSLDWNEVLEGSLWKMVE